MKTPDYITIHDKDDPPYIYKTCIYRWQLVSGIPTPGRPQGAYL